MEDRKRTKTEQDHQVAASCPQKKTWP